MIYIVCIHYLPLFPSWSLSFTVTSVTIIDTTNSSFITDDQHHHYQAKHCHCLADNPSSLPGLLVKNIVHNSPFYISYKSLIWMHACVIYKHRSAHFGCACFRYLAFRPNSTVSPASVRMVIDRKRKPSPGNYNKCRCSCCKRLRAFS